MRILCTDCTYIYICVCVRVLLQQLWLAQDGVLRETAIDDDGEIKPTRVIHPDEECAL